MNLGSGARVIPRRLRASHDSAVKERGEQDARDRLSMFLGCQHTWRPARRFLTKVLQFLSAVGSPKPDLACQSFRPLHRSDAPAFSRSASSLMAAPP